MLEITKKSNLCPQEYIIFQFKYERFSGRKQWIVNFEPPPLSSLRPHTITLTLPIPPPYTQQTIVNLTMLHGSDKNA